jgi:uncharacterized protein with HEPN domain
MSGKVRRTPDYLVHMVKAFGRIAGYVKDIDHAAFDRDTRTQDGDSEPGDRG